MSTFSEACDALVASPPTERELARCHDAVMRSLGGATPGELEAAAARLIVRVEDPDPIVAGLFAITVGALVENGVDPNGVLERVQRRTHEELAHALAYHEELLALGESYEEPAEGEDEEELLYGADYTVPVAAAQAIAARMPRSARAHDALEYLCLSTIACLTREQARRVRVRADGALIEAARPFRRDVGKWLYQLLAGDGDAEWVVLHAVERKGFLVRVQEINDNWAIQPLLAAALLDQREGGLFGIGARQRGLAGGLTGSPPPAELISCLRGHGPPSLAGGARGHWEAYTWRAVGLNGALPDDLLRDRIWNEGIPEDIPMLEGRRVVILAPERVKRSWTAQRSYGALGSDIQHVRTLSRDEVEAWFRRCAAAARA